ncbi:protein-glutamate methylesterase/protein-glutamine glutaminase [Novosphingobium album (ex Liu et al. 2023)]|uniref:Protein-glutamate methylesterase/protein-glutamine glutaminase n=1 Tax=Novosphingobium album (ex Liu et al. 2023) TaxID=3031130 RepID=A0ABT5WX31_9SPHN|nr:chemotaxis response regulator protein-glutamate methylesterase [Novosphingobium album (ex Liu et al. 2023)]MDE8654427.1 chemotaxis response regulator protein-glutamate methylesterase [Novosphingobium album (ex Liu et al. 2023)]
MTIRVLVIDDSPTMRAILMSRLSEQPDISVIGTASNAADGREMIKRFNPDVVTLDIEMPGMNGLDFLEKIMTLRPMPVIIVSGATQEGNETTARALALGAVDCYSKFDPSGKLDIGDNGRLAALIRLAAQVTFNRGQQAAVASVVEQSRRSIDGDIKLIAVGSSTGGVEALQILLSEFPDDCPPTMIVQHVNPRFASAIARTLDSACPARVQIAEADMPVRPGNVYLAPGGDQHLKVGGTRTLRTKLRAGEPVSGHLPSVDALFLSVAEVVGAQAVGILLTGMGADGAKGLLAMHRAGAHTIAQDEATCTVFGMPRAAISLGAARVIAPINRIARHALTKAA